MGTKLIENGCLARTKDEFLGFLAKLDYSKRSIKDYWIVLNTLERYMIENEKREYLPVIGEAFLECKREKQPYCKEYWKHAQTVIRRLNEFIDGRGYTPVLPRSNYECPSQFSRIFASHLNNMELRGLRSSTVKFHYDNCVRALTKLDLAGACRSRCAAFRVAGSRFQVREGDTRFSSKIIPPVVRFFMLLPPLRRKIKKAPHKTCTALHTSKSAAET